MPSSTARSIPGSCADSPRRSRRCSALAARGRRRYPCTERRRLISADVASMSLPSRSASAAEPGGPTVSRDVRHPGSSRRRLPLSKFAAGDRAHSLRREPTDRNGLDERRSPVVQLHLVVLHARPKVADEVGENRALRGKPRLTGGRSRANRIAKKVIKQSQPVSPEPPLPHALPIAVRCLEPFTAVEAVHHVRQVQPCIETERR